MGVRGMSLKPSGRSEVALGDTSPVGTKVRFTPRLGGDNDVKLLVSIEVVRDPVRLCQQPYAPQHASCEYRVVKKLAPGKDTAV